MAKNIMICCDGTGNQYGDNNTNVVKIFEMAKKDAAAEQICYYDPGVGTALGVELWQRVRGVVSAAIGSGLQKNVNDAYRHLMRCYANGDNIYLFGFSRGAFTVRALAGMLYKCGLLHPHLDNMVGYAATMYNTPNNNTIAAKFKQVFSRPCAVHFVGVWDTVESLALNEKFFDATLNPDVRHGYHAVSLDEKRAKFPPSLWKAADKVEFVG